ncbi:hypothetical protein ACQEVC_04335 [Plantactinospora sp. CA-294935]|uniref:hypothetical protein n=1 Tax=Plantactinospora sp. CA-294935 TaxID=3240012 RepID=UPI003D8CA37B
MRVDAGVDDGDSHPFSLANPVRFGNLQIPEVPLIVAHLVGLGRRRWKNSDGRGTKKCHGRAGRAEDHRL